MLEWDRARPLGTEPAAGLTPEREQELLRAWRCHPVECGLRDEMNLTHEYMHHRTGYRLGAGCCWIRIYKGAECDAPVVVCEELPGSEASLRGGVVILAAEVVREHFSGGLPDLPRPLLWVEHRPPAGAGQARLPVHLPPTVPGPWARASCGASPSELSHREPLDPAEVAILIREV